MIRVLRSDVSWEARYRVITALGKLDAEVATLAIPALSEAAREDVHESVRRSAARLEGQLRRIPDLEKR